MDAIKFVNEKVRMCNSVRKDNTCKGCRLHGFGGCDFENILIRVGTVNIWLLFGIGELVMAEYITKESAIEVFEWGDADVIEEYGDGSYNFGFSRENIKNSINTIPTAKAVSLHDIYRVISGHSYYHGDSILAALSCIVEEKEVNPIRPADVAPVVHGKWEYIPQTLNTLSQLKCPFCGWWSLDPSIDGAYNCCPNCGAKMDEKEE